MDNMSLHALLTRQNTHLFASSSSNSPVHRHHFSSRPPRRAAQSARTRKEYREGQLHHPEQARERTQQKYPAASEDTPAGTATAIEPYSSRQVVPGKVYDSLSFDSEDAERG